MIVSLTFPGVYLTDLPPENDKITIAKICWDGGYLSAIKDGKLDYVIRVKIPSEELSCIVAGKRKIYLYNRGKLILRKYWHEFMARKEQIASIWKNNGNVFFCILGLFALGASLVLLTKIFQRRRRVQREVNE